MHGSIDLRALVRNELAQRAESGYGTSRIVASLAERGGLELVNNGDLERLLDDLDRTVRDPDWAYVEPDDLAGIRAESQWPAAPVPVPVGLNDEYADQVHRAWTGRVVGNMLGKPVEGWTREAIRQLLQRRAAWPLADYFPAPDDENADDGYVECWPNTTLGNIDGSCRDDDVDYTILNLHVLRSFGPEFGTDQVAATWLELLPYLQTYTAERVAIRNLVRGDRPEQAAAWRNPYREFIGAAIRADVFGYVAPGDCALAAELAYRDAYLSHRGNGIYSEMWCAALVAAAFATADPGEALDRSLAVVPRRSRLYQAVTDVRRWHAEGLSWDSTRDRIEQAWTGYSWVHAVNNAAVVAAGVLYGAGEFGATITSTVVAGLDTDSNGGTAGSIAGILAPRIEARWAAPLHDLVRSAVFGYDNSALSELAANTVEVAVRLRAGDVTPTAPRSAIARSLW